LLAPVLSATLTIIFIHNVTEIGFITVLGEFCGMFWKQNLSIPSSD
jgi:hypothetical protein